MTDGEDKARDARLTRGTWRIVGAVLVAGAMLIALLLSDGGSQASSGHAGHVADLRGEAVARTDDEARALASNGDVFVGDHVRTGPASRLLLRLGKRTGMRLGAETEIKLLRYLIDAGGEIDLTAGAIEFDRSGDPSSDELTIRSAYGLIAVRGTNFFAGPSRGKFAVFVENGSVTVTASGQTVTLDQSEGTDIVTVGAAPTAPKVWGQGRIDEAWASVR